MSGGNAVSDNCEVHKLHITLDLKKIVFDPYLTARYRFTRIIASIQSCSLLKTAFHVQSIFFVAIFEGFFGCTSVTVSVLEITSVRAIVAVDRKISPHPISKGKWVLYFFTMNF